MNLDYQNKDTNYILCFIKLALLTGFSFRFSLAVLGRIALCNQLELRCEGSIEKWGRVHFSLHNDNLGCRVGKWQYGNKEVVHTIFLNNKGLLFQSAFALVIITSWDNLILSYSSSLLSLLYSSYHPLYCIRFTHLLCLLFIVWLSFYFIKPARAGILSVLFLLHLTCLEFIQNFSTYLWKKGKKE